MNKLKLQQDQHDIGYSDDEITSLEWKVIPNHSDYAVSNLGRIRKESGLEIIKKRIDNVLNVRNNDGIMRTLCFHRVVADWFVDRADRVQSFVKQSFVKHIDGTPLNN